MLLLLDQSLSIDWIVHIVLPLRCLAVSELLQFLAMPFKDHRRMSFCKCECSRRTAAIGWLLSVCFVTGLAGCGGADDDGPVNVTVTGVVLFDEKPLADADVVFIPAENTPGLGGQGRTDQDGKFVLMSARGGEGAPAGEYRVTVSRRLMPDGSPVPENDETPPIESPAQETLPAVYSNAESARLTVVVKEGGPPIEIKLDSKGALP